MKPRFTLSKGGPAAFRLVPRNMTDDMFHVKHTPRLPHEATRWVVADLLTQQGCRLRVINRARLQRPVLDTHSITTGSGGGDSRFSVHDVRRGSSLLQVAARGPREAVSGEGLRAYVRAPSVSRLRGGKHFREEGGTTATPRAPHTNTSRATKGDSVL